MLIESEAKATCFEVLWKAFYMYGFGAYRIWFLKKGYFLKVKLGSYLIILYGYRHKDYSNGRQPHGYMIIWMWLLLRHQCVAGIALLLKSYCEFLAFYLGG